MEVSARREIYALEIGNLYPQSYEGESTHCSSKKWKLHFEIFGSTKDRNNVRK